VTSQEIIYADFAISGVVVLTSLLFRTMVCMK